MTEINSAARGAVSLLAALCATRTTAVIITAWMTMLQMLMPAPTRSCRNMSAPPLSAHLDPAPGCGRSPRDFVPGRLRVRRSHAQNLSWTKCLPFNVAWSSYLPLSDRVGSFTFARLTFLYGIVCKMCEMQLRRARRLLSERTICHGACLLSVAFNIMSRAREYAYQRPYDSTSIGLSFHCRNGSSTLAENRLCCSSLFTSSQILIRTMPLSTTYFSVAVQNPFTYSTPARLYQLRWKMTISPAAGKRSM